MSAGRPDRRLLFKQHNHRRRRRHPQRSLNSQHDGPGPGEGIFIKPGEDHLPLQDQRLEIRQGSLLPTDCVLCYLHVRMCRLCVHTSMEGQVCISACLDLFRGEGGGWGVGGESENERERLSTQHELVNESLVTN